MPVEMDCNPIRRFFRIAGVTIQVESDIPITESTFLPKFNRFAAVGPEDDCIRIRHHFGRPLPHKTAGAEIRFRTPPWRISKQGCIWIYEGVAPEAGRQKVYQIAFANEGHTDTEIYHASETAFRDGGNHSLTLFPTDQILLARVLADRHGCYFHSAGIILDGAGFLFAGHSEAGKSTVVKNLSGSAEILCDDRIIVRKDGRGFRAHGTWSHGEVPAVSAGSAPLKAILFLEQAAECRLRRIVKKKEAAGRLLSLLIKPLVTADWWQKMLALVEEIVREVPCYRLYFRKDDDLTKHLGSI